MKMRIPYQGIEVASRRKRKQWRNGLAIVAKLEGFIRESPVWRIVFHHRWLKNGVPNAPSKAVTSLLIDVDQGQGVSEYGT